MCKLHPSFMFLTILALAFNRGHYLPTADRKWCRKESALHGSSLICLLGEVEQQFVL